MSVDVEKIVNDIVGSSEQKHFVEPPSGANDYGFVPHCDLYKNKYDRRKGADVPNVNITDDSGYIPFDVEVERYMRAGLVHDLNARMNYSNASADRVVDDLSHIYGTAVDKLDLMRIVKERACTVAQAVNIRRSELLQKMNERASEDDKTIQNKSETADVKSES